MTTKKTSTAEVMTEDQLGPVAIPLRAVQVVEVTVTGAEEGIILQNKITEKEKAIILGEAVGGQKDHAANSKRMREGGWKERAHYTTDGKVGHPVEAFLRCMGAAIGKSFTTSKNVKLSYGIELNRNLSISGDAPGNDGEGMLVVFTKHKLAMHTHWAQLNGKTPIPLYRPGISNWEAKLRIAYNPTVFAAKDVLTLLGAAGQMIGVGAYRMEKRGTYGAFKLLHAQIVAK